MIAPVAVLCACGIITEIFGAAIPMWEFLSKDEKMSYLYSTFANQVEDFCEDSPMEKCNYDLLKFGLKTLKGLSEDQLDAMDPYQRGAHTLIWNTMMQNHIMMRTTKKSRPTTTAKPNSYEDQSFGDFGEASAKVETVYKVKPPKDFFYKSRFNALTGVPQYKSVPGNDEVAVKIAPPTYISHPGIDAIDDYNPFDSSADMQLEEHSSIPLTGPMVVRVFPDGTPVEEGKIDIPHDEDFTQFKLSKTKIPSL